MQHLKRTITFFAIIIMLGSLVGCSEFTIGTRSERTLIKILRALETENTDALKGLFPDYALENAPDIDEEIKYIFEVFESEVTYSNIDATSSSGGVEDGKRKETLFIQCEVTTTEASYRLYFEERVLDDVDRSKKGLYKLMLVTEEMDRTFVGDFFNNESTIAGVYKPGNYPVGINNHAKVEYVGDVGHPGAARLDSRGGRIRHLRRQDWTLTT
jgi:hypothetical protein